MTWTGHLSQLCSGSGGGNCERHPQAWSLGSRHRAGLRGSKEDGRRLDLRKGLRKGLGRGLSSSFQPILSGLQNRKVIDLCSSKCVVICYSSPRTLVQMATGSRARGWDRSCAGGQVVVEKGEGGLQEAGKRAPGLWPAKWEAQGDTVLSMRYLGWCVGGPGDPGPGRPAPQQLMGGGPGWGWCMGGATGRDQPQDCGAW